MSDLNIENLLKYFSTLNSLIWANEIRDIQIIANSLKF